MTTDPASLPASRGFNDDVSQISFTNFIDTHTHKNLWIVNKICTIFLSHINWWLRMRNARCAMRVCVCFASIYDNSCRLLFIANWKISWEFPSLHLFFPGKSKRNFSSCFRTNKFHLMICYIHLTYVETYICQWLFPNCNILLSITVLKHHRSERKYAGRAELDEIVI